jgi:hypothetical protein
LGRNGSAGGAGSDGGTAVGGILNAALTIKIRHRQWLGQGGNGGDDGAAQIVEGHLLDPACRPCPTTRNPSERMQTRRVPPPAALGNLATVRLAH